MMLTAATLGMAAYGLYSIVAAVIDVLSRSRMEVVADLALAAFGLLLVLAAAFVRVLIPGGLALAVGALLGLQALSVHSDVHLAGALAVTPQLVRGGLAVLLVVFAYLGGRVARQDPTGTSRP
jgi:hypothetical protein